MATDSTAYLTELCNLLNQHFNVEEARTLCFHLGIDYENISGQEKSAWIRELLLSLGRSGRLPELVALAQEKRPHVTWPPLPEDLQLPTSPATGTPAPPSVVHNYYGDVVQGNKVGGDKITAGNILGSSGVAIGRGAWSAHAPPPNQPAPLPLYDLPLQNPTFTGRTELLQQLEASLMANHLMVVTQAITGMGGIGKTQLALAYAHQHLADYSLVYWLPADDPSTLAGGLVTLAQRLGLASIAETDQDNLVGRLHQWLGQTEHRWLLILDNADLPEPRQLRPYLPPAGRGNLLITSRNPNWAGTARTLPVELFTEEEAVAFWRRRTGDKLEDESDCRVIHQLGGALGYLPLALEHTAAYIIETGITPADYHTLFMTRRRDLWQEFRPPDSYHATIATTWQLAFDQIYAANPAAVVLLDLCAFLAPDGIPLSLLRENVNYLPDELTAAVADPIRLNKTIAALQRYSLLKRDQDSLTLHRLVQAVIRDRMGRESAREWLERATTLLVHAYPFDEDDLGTWAESTDWLPHARTVTDLAQAFNVETTDTGDLCNHLGFYLDYFGDLAPARPLFERALAIREATLGPGHPDTATSLNNLASLLHNQGDLAAARPLYERTLAIREAALGPDHPDTASSLNNLASLLHDQGGLAAARPLYERALTIREAALGSDHPDTATSLNNLASLLYAEGDLAAARPLLERALAICEAVLGPNHPDTATSLNNLASLLQAQGDLSAARPLYERAVAITEAALGPNHPDTAGSLNNLAGLLRDQGDLAAARPLYERALIIREAALGPNHSSTAQSLNNLANLLKALGDLVAARPLYERALAIYETALGSGHPSTALSLNNLARLLQVQGDLAAARPLYERALAILEAALGLSHPNTAIVRNNLASLDDQPNS